MPSTTAKLCVVALTFGLASVPASAAVLGLMEPMCNLLPEVSKEAAAFLGLFGLVMILFSVFQGEKGEKSGTMVVRIFIVVVGLIGIVPLGMKTFPGLQSYMCN
ncbi:hypothetical protein [Chitinimonas koreensis]|uniref:hypothetical protein n=1 Tax=Chitinimonas koreensis TaxID=356302 RepID=UPI000490CFFC|nr:hypothetical protein [Chitinimonas koreensis]QNM95532.1 hypothetical protein H9L41_16900 [Chitinimonas koreensis]